MSTPNKAAFMKAGSPAEAAKILGHTDGGKRFRARLRTIAGKEKDNPNRFDAKAKAALWAAFVEGKTAAKAEKPKKASKPRKAKTEKVEA
jgi:hypothetical protein